MKTIEKYIQKQKTFTEKHTKTKNIERSTYETRKSINNQEKLCAQNQRKVITFTISGIVKVITITM